MIINHRTRPAMALLFVSYHVTPQFTFLVHLLNNPRWTCCFRFVLFFYSTLTRSYYTCNICDFLCHLIP
jgi:hypothetical protein